MTILIYKITNILAGAYMDFLIEELKKLNIKNELRDFKVLETYQDVIVKWNGNDLHLMGSNNYLSLNNDPRLNQIAKEVTDSFGTGSGGSRLTTGTTSWHRKLEEYISELKSTADSLIFGSGYMANLGVISGIADKSFTVFSDRYNHASINDGIALSGATLSRYKHMDLIDLEKRVAACDSNRKIIVTDSVFSMDGSIAPIKEISEISKKYGCILIVDDAHGLGVLGENGLGISDYLGLKDEIDLTIGTLSKSIPSSGGYVTGRKVLIDLIRNKSRSFIFSTSLPPSAMAVAHRALSIIVDESDRRTSLIEKTNYFIDKLRNGGVNIDNQLTPIIPIIIGEASDTMEIQRRLLEDGIFIPGIRPPTVPRGTSRLRASVNSAHTYMSLDYIAARIVYHYNDVVSCKPHLMEI